MKAANPEISIVTPSYNMLSYLKLCCASVKDQDVLYEHIIMDGGSTDGSAEWLTNNPEVIAVSEKDKGMYNALNKAINKAKGNIIGHLNCDEQYLPGVLKYIKNYFDENPSIDFVAMDFLVITPKGNLVAYRKSFQPKWFYFFSNYLYTNTCSLFYRREIFDAYKFDESYRSIADVIFVYNVIKSGYKGKHVSKFSAVFTYSGDNLSLNQISQVEKKKFNNTLPIWYKILKPVFFVMFFVEKFFNRTYLQKSPLSYAIFTNDSLSKRVTFTETAPTFRLKFKANEVTSNQKQNK